MEEIGKLDPQSLAGDPRVVASVEAEEAGGRSYYVVVAGGLAALATSELFRDRKTGEEEWIGAQVEMPKAGIPWIVRTLEEKFFRTSQEGGLERGSIHVSERIAGENLYLIRGVGVGGPGSPGYELKTLSRRNPATGLPRRYPMSDELLFERGFLELLKEVAARIERGDL